MGICNFCCLVTCAYFLFLVFLLLLFFDFFGARDYRRMIFSESSLDGLHQNRTRIPPPSPQSYHGALRTRIAPLGHDNSLMNFILPKFLNLVIWNEFFSPVKTELSTVVLRQAYHNISKMYFRM